MVRPANLAATVLGTLALAACVLPARLAADEPRLLSVIGNGQTEVKADTLELSLTVSAGGTLASEALDKLRKNHKRALEAIDTLKIPGLSMVSGATTFGGTVPEGNVARRGRRQVIINGQVMMLGDDEEPMTAGTNVFHQTLTLRIGGLEKLTEDQAHDLHAKVVDQLKSTKFAARRNVAGMFRLEHPEAGQAKALDLAIADARSHAERLARGLGIHIGKIARARETRTRDFRRGAVEFQEEMPTTYAAPRPAPGATNVPKFTLATSVSVDFEIVD